MRRTPKRALLVGFAAAFAWTLSLRIHPLTVAPPTGERATPALAKTVRPTSPGSGILRPAGSLAPQALQFHVVANSNRPVDQAVKLAVRTRLLETLAPALEEATGEGDALRRAERMAPALQRETDQVLRELGQSYQARVVVGKAWVPNKTWGSVKLPAGIYPTLTVLLGQAQGQNWWCVVFPPLCLVNPAAAVMQNVPPTGPERLLGGALHHTHAGREPAHGVHVHPGSGIASFFGSLMNLLFG